MKKTRLFIPILVTILAITCLQGFLMAAEKAAELSVLRQRVNLDIDKNGRNDKFAVQVELYKDGTVEGQGTLAGRNISFERGLISPGLFGSTIRFDILYDSPGATDRGTLTFEQSAQGEFNVILNLATRGVHQFRPDYAAILTTYLR
ncbi:MAG: hypothetical protein R3293_13175 [Candidatus Promineifilaceae bacterium]|nr:hypothetical protein [Candidatus Promineifilaceae bacterium]